MKKMQCPFFDIEKWNFQRNTPVDCGVSKGSIVALYKFTTCLYYYVTIYTHVV